MANRVVIKLRLLAALAPVALLAAAPFLLGGFYAFGQTVEILRDHALLAVQAARGMELALYQIEWSVTRPDGDQIMQDQRRQFIHWLDLAKDRAESDEQRKLVVVVAGQAEPIFELLRQVGRSALRDDSIQRQLRELHGQINDLIGANDAMVVESSARAQRQARRLIAVGGVVMVLVPWLGFAWMAKTTGEVHKELRSIREHLENLTPRLGPAGAAAEAEAQAMDEALTRLGFAPPNPMLAE